MVDVDVCGQIAALREAEAAEGAGVRPLPGVDAEVPVQTRLEREAEGAELAAEGSVPVVDPPDVSVGPALSGERFTAVWTRVRPLPGVHSHVRPKVSFGNAFEFTHRTIEKLFHEFGSSSNPRFRVHVLTQAANGWF